MRDSTRSQLRRLLLIWAAAWLTAAIGLAITFGISVYGLGRVFASLVSDTPSLTSLLLPLIGIGLQLGLTILIIGIQERFEARCWDMIAASSGAPVADASGGQVLADQVNGESNLLAEVRTRRARRFSARLRTLIAEAWPDRRR